MVFAKRIVSLLVVVGSLLLNWYVFFKIAGAFKSSDPQFVATALVVAITFHEFCHWAVFEANGVKAFFFLAVVMGGTSPYPSDRKKAERFPWHTQAKLALAGVAGNLAIIAGSAVLYHFGAMSLTHLRMTTDLNAGLVLFNLLPLGFLDGGRFAKAFFDSVSEDLDLAYVHGIVAAVILVSLAVTMFSHESFSLPIFLLFWGLRKKATEDDPAGSFSKLAMTRKQQVFWAVTYVLLLCASIVLSSVAPRSFIG